MAGLFFNALEKYQLNRSYMQGRFELHPLQKLLQLSIPKKDHLSIHSQSNSQLAMQSNTQIHKVATASRVITHRGDTLEIRSQYAQQTIANNQARTILAQQSRQAVEGKVNGKKVALTTEKELNQVSNEARKTTSAENRDTTELIDRNVNKNGKMTVVNTHYDTNTQGALNINSEYNRYTETEQKARTYDKNGKLAGNSYSNQAVTVDQTAATARAWQGEGTRDITQTTKVNDSKEGNATVRNTKNETVDVILNQTIYNTLNQTNTATKVENLDENGNVLATRNYSQLAASNDIRTVDYNRVATSDQNIQVINRKGENITNVEGRYDINAVTVDQTNITGTIQNFNGDNALTGQTNYERNVTTTTVENREGENNSHAAVTQNKGETLTVNTVNSHENAGVNTRIVSEQNGVTTQIRSIDTETQVKTSGNLETKAAANGVRTLDMEAEQVRLGKTEDLTVNSNGQARLVETKIIAAQAFDGQMEFNPVAGPAGAPQAAPGAMVVDLYSNTGIRANFKLDNGVLNFDFTARRLAGSYQETVTGQAGLNPNNPVEKGATVSQERGTFEDIHFTGQVISSTDAEGNRVIELKGNITDQGVGALLVNNFNGFETEQSKAEMEINGKLTVDRQATTTGNVTKSQYNATAEMEINRVENTEREGVNLRSLTPLNTSDGARAGLIASNGYLRFNFGIFNLGLSFIA
jgi:hypothetical protein